MQEKRLQTIRNKRQSKFVELLCVVSRSFSSDSSSRSTYIAVLPLSSDISFKRIPDFLCQYNEDWIVPSSSGSSSDDVHNLITLQSKSQKTNFTFFTPGISEYSYDPLAILEALSICQSVLLLVDFGEENMVNPLIDDLGDKILQLLLSYGYPYCSVGYLTPTGMKGKWNLKNPPKIWKNEMDKAFSSFSLFNNGSDHPLKYYDLKDNNVARYLNENIINHSSKQSMKWRQQRSYLLSDDVKVLEKDEAEETEKGSKGTCKIIVRGVLQGLPLKVNSLVHIVGVGVGRIHRIKKYDPSSTKSAGDEMKDDDEEEEDDFENEVVTADPSKQESIAELEAEHDILQGEQTWPQEGEEGLMHYDEEGDDEDIDATGLDDEEGGVNDFFNREQLPGGKEQTTKGIEGTTTLRSLKEEREHDVTADHDEDDEERGDFVDTPFDIPSRKRFARYRAMQSFRATNWNPKELLPEQYSKIYEFEDMKNLQKQLNTTSESLLKSQFAPFLQVYQKSNNNRSGATSVGEGEASMEIDNNSFQGNQSITKSKSTKQLIHDLPLLLEGTEDCIRSGELLQSLFSLFYLFFLLLC
jgi:hypothetical protein